MAFGFPKRAANDFRYNKALGGGALLDCGGYPIRLALELLGDSTRVTQSRLVQPDGYEVDLYGNAVIENDEGQVAQISFGMDNSYKCELEVWGSTGCLTASRIFTAPDGFEPEITIQTQQGSETRKLTADDSFGNSISRFFECMGNDSCRMNRYRELHRQAQLVEIVKGDN